MRRILPAWILLLAVTAPLAADGKDDTLKLLVGKWQVTQKSGEREVVGVMELTANGKASMKVKNALGETSFAGTFKLIDESNVEMTFTVRDMPITDRSKLKVTKDELELTDPKGKTKRYTRIP